jgi:hypothetical protein
MRGISGHWNEAHKMLQNLDDQVRDCVNCAANCAEQARGVADPRERDEWMALRSRYLAIARGIETRRDSAR